MGDSHSKSFFGQNAGLLLNTSSKQEPFFFIRCIKKKPDGNWEKPSQGEGKVIRFSLEEAIMVLQVLNRKLLNWKSYHTYKDIKTPISFGWEDEKAKTLWINIGNYSKMLSYSGNFNPPDDIIEFEEDFNIGEYVEEENQIGNSFQSEAPAQTYNNNNSDKASQITGSLKGETAKALLINFQSGKELWIPKSTIHSNYQIEKNVNQKFLIDTWILKKNKILS